MNTRQEVRETLRLALPITFAQVALMTMGLVGQALVGRVSAVELSTVSLGNALAFALLCPAMGVTMAVEPLASQAVGAGDADRAWLSFRAGLVACLLLSVPTMIAVAASSLLLPLFGVDERVIWPTTRFIFARLPGVPCWLVFMAGKAYLEANGLIRPLLVGGWVANIVNFFVSVPLIFGDRALGWIGLGGVGLPALGSLGAGIATTVANFLLAAIALTAAWKARPRGARWGGNLEALRERTRMLMRVGVPIGFQILTEVGVFTVMTLLAGRLGARVSAAHQIAMGLASLTFMGVLGLSGATAVRVGRAIGAGEPEGPRQAGLVGIGLAMVYMTFTAALFLAAPALLSRIFTEDPAIVESAVTLVRVAAAFQIFDGIQGVAGGALRGAADTTFASWVNVACHWGVGLPLAILLCFGLHLGAPGLWWGVAVGLLIVSVVLTLRFLRVTSRSIAAL